MVFNATFNNVSVISWRSVLLVGETGIPGENHRLATSHWQTLSHGNESSTPRHERNYNSQRWWRDTDCIDIVNTSTLYHTITTKMAPLMKHSIYIVGSMFTVNFSNGRFAIHKIIYAHTTNYTSPTFALFYHLKKATDLWCEKNKGICSTEIFLHNVVYEYF